MQKSATSDISGLLPSKTIEDITIDTVKDELMMTLDGEN